MDTRHILDPVFGLSQWSGPGVRPGGAVGALRRDSFPERKKRGAAGGFVSAFVIVLMLALAACGSSVGPPGPEPGPGTTSRGAGATSGDTGTPSGGAGGTASQSGCASRGTVKHLTFDDSSQGKYGDYQIYLPPCYHAHRTARYPVVYLLHGAGHDDAYWLEVGINNAADKAIARGEIAPMIIVLPDGGPYYAAGRGDVTFDSYLVDELVPRIDGSYRTRATRGGRAIGGISLGGGQALAIAAKAPTKFVAAGGHSPALTDTATLAADLHQGHVRIWLDVGDTDSLRTGTIALDAKLRAAGAAVQLHLAAGGHEESYWHAHLREYLDFYDESFSPAE